MLNPGKDYDSSDSQQASLGRLGDSLGRFQDAAVLSRESCNASADSLHGLRESSVSAGESPNVVWDSHELPRESLTPFGDARSPAFRAEDAPWTDCGKMPQPRPSIWLTICGSRRPDVLFPAQAEARVPAIMAKRHDPHAIEFFIEEQVIGEFFKIGTTPATRIEMKTLGVCFHLEADSLEFRPKIVA